LKGGQALSIGTGSQKLRKKQGVSQNRILHSLRTSIIILLTLSHLAHADNSPVAASSLSESDFGPICQSTLDNASNPANTTKLQYCQSAQSSLTAAHAEGAMWKVWAAVAGVCGAACAASFAGVGNQFICIGVNSAAGITDAIVTKNFMNAMMAIGVSGMSYMITSNTSNNSSLSKDEKSAKPPEKPKDIGACLAAATAAFQSYMSHSSEQSDLTSLKNNLASAASSDSTATGATTSVSLTSSTGTSGNGVVANSSVGGSGTLNPSSSNSLANNPNALSSTACGSTTISQNANYMVQCALAANQAIPPTVATAPFANSFQKSSGTSLNDFLTNPNLNQPGQAIAAAMGGTLNTDQAVKLAAAIKTFEQQLPTEIPNGFYAGGGRGRSLSSGEGSDPDLGALMQGVMGQFMQKPQDTSDPNTGMASVIFANKNGTPTAVAENKQLSIFDRVSYRYFFVGARILDRDGKAGGGNSQ